MLSVDCLLMELMDFGGPPSMDRDKVWSAATSSTAWKLPSFTVSTLRERENRESQSRHFRHPSCERGIAECAVGCLCLRVHVPVYGRRRVRSGVVADPEAPPVQLHGDVIIVPFIQQHTTVLICRNLRAQQGVCVEMVITLKQPFFLAT